MRRAVYRHKSMIIIGLVVAFAMSTACAFSRYDYAIGRDTVEVFGNGEFQLCKTSDTLLLSDVKCQVVVISSIIGWEEQGDKAYFVGTDQADFQEIKVYGVLKMKENTIQLYFEGELDNFRQSQIQKLCDEGSGIQLTSSTDIPKEDWTILMSLYNKIA